ncbi:MAG: dihydroorotate dehydrogenase electron transfer subunit [Muribaculum sp.]|nr:dihydroorotate dehydrogenase electron transfer subunit [Muribaculaceae bacterium]MCM1080997.1 dihydroorotate dehydrogenase electron transfer subunit [Muribaculum sp.]
MKKYIMDFDVVENRYIHDLYSLLILKPAGGKAMPEIAPGQFVQVRIDNSKTTFLRRPISVNYVDSQNNTLWLLVRKAGEGTRALAKLKKDDTLNLVLPLGNCFKVRDGERKFLLVGGGVGIAPMLYWGSRLKKMGFTPEFLVGARSQSDLLELDELKTIGTVHVSTDDGSAGSPGVVTLNPALNSVWDRIYCCGPAPMMKAVAAVAQKNATPCEVSLENMMACGLGACLCCVENTVKGNVCVCTEGPIFNTEELTWHD